MLDERAIALAATRAVVLLVGPAETGPEVIEGFDSAAELEARMVELAGERSGQMAVLLNTETGEVLQGTLTAPVVH